MTSSDNRLIVVRAWQDTGRLVIRLIVSAGPGAPAVEFVFSDIESATDRLSAVLAELSEHQFGCQTEPRPRRTQSVDATAAPADHHD